MQHGRLSADNFHLCFASFAACHPTNLLGVAIYFSPHIKAQVEHVLSRRTHVLHDPHLHSHIYHLRPPDNRRRLP